MGADDNSAPLQPEPASITAPHHCTQVCDEFLVCNQCRKMRQQLRVWNKFQDVMLDDLKHPVVLRSVDLLSDCIVGH